MLQHRCEIQQKRLPPVTGTVRQPKTIPEMQVRRGWDSLGVAAGSCADVDLTVTPPQHKQAHYGELVGNDEESIQTFHDLNGEI